VRSHARARAQRKARLVRPVQRSWLSRWSKSTCAPTRNSLSPVWCAAERSRGGSQDRCYSVSATFALARRDSDNPLDKSGTRFANRNCGCHNHPFGDVTARIRKSGRTSGCERSSSILEHTYDRSARRYRSSVRTSIFVAPVSSALDTAAKTRSAENT
jgi:hypothetical protein